MPPRVLPLIARDLLSSEASLGRPKSAQACEWGDGPRGDQTSRYCTESIGGHLGYARLRAKLLAGENYAKQNGWVWQIRYFGKEGVPSSTF